MNVTDGPEFDSWTASVTEEPTLVCGNVTPVVLANSPPFAPVPSRAIICGLVVELSVMVKVPVRSFGAKDAFDGVNATGIVQD